jgi:alkylation response protein AidB-like acyl-CoA dehydrogenase
MDFNDTPEEAGFRAEARAFLDANAELKGRDDAAKEVIDRDAADPIRAAQEWQALKADNGWACITWPKEFGGRGGTPIQSVIWSQEEGRYKTPPNIFVIGIGMAGPTIMTHGTPEQKERYR